MEYKLEQTDDGNYKVRQMYENGRIQTTTMNYFALMTILETTLGRGELKEFRTRPRRGSEE